MRKTKTSMSYIVSYILSRGKIYTAFKFESLCMPKKTVKTLDTMNMAAIAEGYPFFQDIGDDEPARINWLLRFPYCPHGKRRTDSFLPWAAVAIPFLFTQRPSLLSCLRPFTAERAASHIQCSVSQKRCPAPVQNMAQPLVLRPQTQHEKALSLCSGSPASPSHFLHHPSRITSRPFSVVPAAS